MQSRSKNHPAFLKIQTIDKNFDQAILWITLSTLLIIPIIFSYFDITAVFSEPRIVTLHLAAGLIAILWIWQIAMRMINPISPKIDPLSWDLLKWAGRNPARWALIGAAVWFLAQIASTLLSPLPIISFFGGDEARSGYNLYDSLSLGIIFLSIAIRFRSLQALTLLAYALVITGTITASYGIAQHFGWDPIGGNIGLNRVQSSFGNTLNFSGYMVMTIPATIAITHVHKNRNRTWFSFITLALSLQLLGLYFASGRGPFIAAVLSLTTLFTISVAITSTRETLKSTMVLLIAGLLALPIILIPTSSNHTLWNRLINIGGSFNISTDKSTNAISTDEAFVQAGLPGRYNIWESSMKIATQWNVPIQEPLMNSIFRPLFGLGPDMYVYSYPLVAKPSSQLSLVDHAHNFELQVLMEHGFIGFIGFTTLTGLIAISAIKAVKRYRKTKGQLDPTGIILLALLPALIGKLFEMQSGVARVSDLAMTFALFGAGIAIYEILNKQNSISHADTSDKITTSQAPTTHAKANRLSISAILLIAITITTIIIGVFVTWDARRLSSSLMLAVGHDHPSLDQRAKVWADAQAKAPERESMTFALFETYLATAKEQYELGNPKEAMRLLMAGREMLLIYEKRDPLMLNVQIGLSKTTSTLAEWGHHEYLDELTYRSQKLASIGPAYPTLLGTTATAMTSVGLHELAIEYAEMAIATEKITQPWSKAWYAKGRSLYELGKEEEAIAALTTATEKQPGAEGALLSHQFLALIYRAQGNSELSKLHSELGGNEITFDE